MMSRRPTEGSEPVVGATGPCVPSEDGGCSLCGDVAVSARIVSIDVVARVATAAAGTTEVVVGLDLVDGVDVGDTVLVHQGFAIARLEAS
jgi:hydrogenase maturation factor